MSCEAELHCHDSWVQIILQLIVETCKSHFQEILNCKLIFGSTVVVSNRRSNDYKCCQIIQRSKDLVSRLSLNKCFAGCGFVFSEKLDIDLA